jgi:hypothetical protein
VTHWDSDEELYDTVRRDLFTAVVGDVMDTMGLLRWFLLPHIKLLRDDMVVIGRAMTVLEADVFAESHDPSKPGTRAAAQGKPLSVDD